MSALKSELDATNRLKKISEEKVAQLTLQLTEQDNRHSEECDKLRSL